MYDTPTDVFYCGQMNVLCPHCSALHWQNESTSGSKSHPDFSMCCSRGKIFLARLPDIPLQLRNLFDGHSQQAKEFQKNIVLYNRALAFTSMGVQQDYSVLDGHGPPIFRIHGELKHWIGSLLPAEGNAPSYSQLYIYDPAIALQYRMTNNPDLNRNTMRLLQDILHHINPYTRLYKQAYEILQDHNAPDYSIRLAPASRGYHAPANTISPDQVAVILPGTNSEEGDHRDIILTLRARYFIEDNRNKPLLQRINEGHPSYEPLHFVLLFPFGNPGWNWEMRQSNGRRLTQREHAAFRLHDRHGEYSTILRGRRLLQHYTVNMFAAIDQNRLNWYRQNQPQFRMARLHGLEDAINQNDDNVDLHNLGQRVILPSSHTGSPRDMHNRYQDSMAIARLRRKIDLFLTVTANPNWREILDELLEGQQPWDRPDLIARVFKMKLDMLIKLITKKGIFGKSVAHIYTVEFQKKGLPHAHILIFLDHPDQLSTPDAIDKVIWARFPDPIQHPALFEKVKKYMIHGPCGDLNKKAPCMQKGKCRFGFPKSFQNRTILAEDNYPTYYRPNDGITITMNGFTYDNRWVAPYNPFCLMAMDAHANCECPFGFWTTKYLNKYLKKDGETTSVHVTDKNDEITQYITGRYFSAIEASWHIFAFDMHGNYPSVIRLPVHLPKEQSVIFDPEDIPEHALLRGEQVETALTAFFDANKNNGPLGEEARKHTYQEFPQYFTLKTNGPHKFWDFRQHHHSIGRMASVSPTAGERFHLRILLTVSRGPKSFKDLRRVNGSANPCPTFHDACVAKGLLEDDREWDICLEEASDMRTGPCLRSLFATILQWCQPTFPDRLWNSHKRSICDDLPHRLRSLGYSNFTEEMVYDYGLWLLNKILNDSGKALSSWPAMPKPMYDWETATTNQLIAEQLNFDPEEEQAAAARQMSTFSDEQREAYNRIWDSIANEKGHAFFIDGPGGSGKTYLYQTLCHAVRAERWIILCVAATGLAALLLPGGRTAHSTFKIPISDLNEDSVCQIAKESGRADLLRAARALLYDECLMNNKHCFEALDKTLRDIRNRPNDLYGGLTTIHGGDFQQILPVIINGRKEDIINACLLRSYLWPHMQIIHLHQNMRLEQSAEDILFANWLLDVGHGCNIDKDGKISLPDRMVTTSHTDFVQWCYGDMFNLPCPPPASYFLQRAILAPRNFDVLETNRHILTKMPGSEVDCWSADSLISENGENPIDGSTVPIEYLHSLEPAGLPPAHLRMKPGCPLILLRNLRPSDGLCNGTRMTLLRAMPRILEVRIMGGEHDGKVALLPRIALIPSTEEGYTFQFKRKQFPIKLAFAMTIHKAEGQSLRYVAVDLRVPVFSHGQLYVALSRATSAHRVKVLLPHDAKNTTENVVYQEIFQ